VTKLAFWAEPELEERLLALHEGMKKDPRLRGLRLTKTDVLKMLIRQSLDWAEIEYMGIAPDKADPEEALAALDQQYQRHRAVLDKMIADAEAEMRKRGSRKKRG
jgi:hypothetical protein